MTEKLLTKDEDKVLNALADAWDGFLELPELHTQDRQEFMNAIHVAQNIVLARPVLRERNEKRDSNSVALSLAIVRKMKRDRLNASMGR